MKEVAKLICELSGQLLEAKSAADYYRDRCDKLYEENSLLKKEIDELKAKIDELEF
ncbi:MAG: hypothetical protein ACI4IK_01460 [Eubacterium sp.]